MNVINLKELTNEQLQLAIQKGEGLTEKVTILDQTADPETLESIPVEDYDGNIYDLPTLVLYSLVIEDKVNDEEIDAKVYVRMTHVGVLGQF